MVDYVCFTFLHIAIFLAASKEFYNKEKDLMTYVKKFRNDKATKQLLAVSQNSALHYCGFVL